MVDLRMRHKSMCLELVCVCVFLLFAITALAQDIGLASSSLPLWASCACANPSVAHQKTAKYKKTHEILWRLFGHKSLSSHTKTEITSNTNQNQRMKYSHTNLKKKRSKNSENSTTHIKWREIENDRVTQPGRYIFFIRSRQTLH